ncbi:MAG: bidirectional hydrogenase complex protein HoxE [Candidatus Obscuribacterales bacterium]|jgi:bidirectional [NiFe] hydrogenase diaphorase subunit
MTARAAAKQKQIGKFPSDDKRWLIVAAVMRKYGSAQSALIETLHAVQSSFGYLDDSSLAFVARSLRLPLSKVYGVATFYSHFRLKPQGKHTCVVCMGTACYIKGSAKLLQKVDRKYGLKVGDTSADNKLSLLEARCLGACGIAPAGIFDGTVLGNLSDDLVESKIDSWIAEPESVSQAN